MAPTPLNLIERRIWRLSFLLTGNELAAASLVDRVLRAHDVREMEPTKLDRLIVQQAREMLGTGYGPARKARRRPPASPLLSAAGPRVQQGFGVVQSLPEQPREAWVLAKVDELDELHVSRAMDCSKKATMNHLSAGDSRVREELKDEYEGVIGAMREFADSLDPGPIIAEHRARRLKMRVRRAGIMAVMIATVLLVLALVVLKGWFGTA